jgi:predicted nucleic acid-binding protein
VAHGLTMVTANVREFARVPGLAVEVWGNVP